ncbi:MAG: HAD hydrolase-like protein [Myxococcaceae bacterium]|nr:HAD hydrolase-like protein [Myxococcaceae bacterium]
MIRAVTGFSTLAEVLRTHARAKRVVAFDMFNTLVRRQVEGEWLKRAAAFRVHELLAPWVHRWFLPTPESVFERRREIERQVVAERVARGEDNEADFAEVARRWIATWVPIDNEALVAACVESELRLEALALSATPGSIEAVRALKVAGARLIVVSDMYLSSQQLQRLLDSCGFADLFDEVYTSTDVGKRKATGRIFPWLLETEAIAASDLLFVGDDLEADQVQPGRHGIDTVHVVDESETSRRTRLKALERLASSNHVWNVPLIDELIERLPDRASQQVEGDVDYELGQTLAPGLVAFVLDTVDLARRRGAKRIFFLAREGLTFLRIYGRLLEQGLLGPRPPEARYLYVSRASTMLPAMRGLAWDDLQRFWRQYPNQTLLTLLKNLSLPTEPFVGLAASVGLTQPRRRLGPPEDDLEFRRFLESRDVHAAFAEARDAAKDTLRDYLTYRGLWGQDKVVIADIGWKGTMQDNLARAFESERGMPELFGAYLALASEGERYPRSYKHGFLADFRRSDAEELDLFRNTAIYEMVTQAAHGSTVGYRRRPENPAAVLPELKEYEIERENAQRYFRRAREGIDAWTRDFTRVASLSPFTGEQLRAGALARALDYIRYPTRQQAEAFLRYSHVESFGVHQVSRFGFDVRLADLIARSPRKTWRELQRRFEHTMWREGVVKRSRLPLGTLLWDLYVTLQRAG